MASKLNKYDGSGRLYGLDNPRPFGVAGRYFVRGYALSVNYPFSPVEKLVPYCDGKSYLKRLKRAAAKSLSRRSNTRGR